jgi:quinol monooxygenase YgiN
MWLKCSPTTYALTVLILTAFLECGPADRDALIAAANTCVVETNKEAGCLEYRVYEDTAAPGKFVILERWTDQQSLDAHGRTAHLASFREAMTELVTQRDIKLYDVAREIVR